MKNRLAITLTLILCFASMTFAQGPSQFGQVGTAVNPPDRFPPTQEVNLVMDDTSFHINVILEPIENFFSDLFM